MLVTMQIFDANIDSIKTAFEVYANGHEVSDGRINSCSHADCPADQNYGISSFIGEPPSILISVLGRFEYPDVCKDLNGKLYQPDPRKNNKVVTTTEHLEIISGEWNVQYRLQSVICHFGSGTTRGHYVAFVRGCGGFYRCNDDLIKKADPNWMTDTGNQSVARNGYLYVFSKL
jgi:ubiquitin C-terminal hydrolase